MQNYRHALPFIVASAFLLLLACIGVLLTSQHNPRDQRSQLRTSLIFSASSTPTGAAGTVSQPSVTQHTTHAGAGTPEPTLARVGPQSGASPTSTSGSPGPIPSPTWASGGPGPTASPTSTSGGPVPSATPTPTPTPAPTSPPSSNVIFSDNFAGSTLSAAWTLVNRHGEYAQNETECNVPGAVSVANNVLSITTTAQSATCGDFNLDGSVRHSPATWPYTTGDVQWTSFAFTYGTITYRAKFPPQATGTWPAIWLLGSNCQATNIVTADTGYASCPALQAPGYVEMDLTECFGGTWCQLALAQPNGWPTCTYAVDSNWHTYTFSWTASAISLAVDGQPTGCGFSAATGYVIPSTPMFLLIQTQTGGVGGTPNDSNLPTTLQVSSVTVTQP